MTATTAQEATAVSNTPRFTEILKNAVEGFKRRVVHKTGGVATDDEVDAFVAQVSPGIQKSIEKAATLNVVTNRLARYTAIRAVAAHLGLKFNHNRDLEEVEADSYLTEMTAFGYTEVTDVELVNATRGGTTIAFKYVLDEQNNLSINFSTAFCRKDENFDPLIGMEESVKKFQAGLVLSAPIAHERFGKVKLDQLASASKELEETAKAFANFDAIIETGSSAETPTAA